MAHRQLAGEEIRFADLADCCKGEGAWRLYALCGYVFLYTLAFYVLEYGIDLNDGWVLSWLAFLGMAGITAPTLCALGGKQASTAILDGIGGAFRNWGALLVFVLWLVPLCFFFAVFGVTFDQLLRGLTMPTSSFRPWVAWEVGQLAQSICLGPCLFLFFLVGYMATRDMFYEE